MAGMVKLRRSKAQPGECPVRAVRFTLLLTLTGRSLLNT